MTDGVSQLPIQTLPRVPRHVFGPDHFVKRDASKGREHDQTERACPCGVVKITVFGKEGAWREWRLPGAPYQQKRMPPCSLYGAAG